MARGIGGGARIVVGKTIDRTGLKNPNGFKQQLGTNFKHNYAEIRKSPGTASRVKDFSADYAQLHCVLTGTAVKGIGKRKLPQNDRTFHPQSCRIPCKFNSHNNLHQRGSKDENRPKFILNARNSRGHVITHCHNNG